MGISGFTIIRNGEKLGYPYKESLLSLAPFVDEIVVALGDCEDATALSLDALKKQISLPLRVIHSPWDSANTKAGSELARQSNIALSHCTNDICFYLQGDEVLNDFEENLIREDLNAFLQDERLDALAFRWRHFYGNFSTYVESRQWYRREVRVLRKSHGCQSYGDAQGFRIFKGGRISKPRAALSRAHVHHYGWVRPPLVMAQKSEALDRLWHGTLRDGSHSSENVYPPLFGMKSYTGQHPAVMKTRVAELKNCNPFASKTIKKNLRYFKLVSTAMIEKVSGWRPGEFKNFDIQIEY